MHRTVWYDLLTIWQLCHKKFLRPLPSKVIWISNATGFINQSMGYLEEQLPNELARHNCCWEDSPSVFLSGPWSESCLGKNCHSFHAFSIMLVFLSSHGISPLYSLTVNHRNLFKLIWISPIIKISPKEGRVKGINYSSFRVKCCQAFPVSESLQPLPKWDVYMEQVWLLN